MLCQVIDNATAYDALLADCTIPENQSIAGIPRHARFEELSPEQIASLNDWFLKNGKVCILRISTVEFALHLMGARQVDPSKEIYNWVRGKGKDKSYWFLERNQHNRIERSSNYGSIAKEGLCFDIANRYWGLGPAAHIDAYAWLLSIQHRCKGWVKVCDELGEVAPPIDLLTIVGMPPQLAATLDRGAPKTGQDQEFIDREQFSIDFLTSNLEYVPEDKEKLRNELSGYLVTTRNNLWSRLHGTGYHPSKPHSPSTRQALALQERFVVDGQDQLQLLLIRIWERSIGEDGAKRTWVKQLPIPMVAVAAILASNVDAGDDDGESAISVDWETVNLILDALGEVSDEGNEGFSNYIREVARIRKQPKKASGLDRWVFWGFVGACQDILAGNPCGESYFPNVTPALVKKIKEGKIGYPIFGGLDCGPKEEVAAE